MYGLKLYVIEQVNMDGDTIPLFNVPDIVAQIR